MFFNMGEEYRKERDIRMNVVKKDIWSRVIPTKMEKMEKTKEEIIYYVVKMASAIVYGKKVKEIILID